MDLYDEVADLYDLWSECDPASEPSKKFYVQYALRVGSPVVEIGSGTGRITYALAEVGIRVTAVERSERILSLCKSRISFASPEIQANVSLLNSDVMNMEESGTAPVVILPLRTLGHFLTRKHRLDLFRKVWGILSPGGRFVFDHFVFREDPAPRGGEELKLLTRSILQGREVLLWHLHRCDYLQKVLDCNLIHEMIGVDGFVESRMVHPYQLAWVDPREVVELASVVGFEVSDMFGNFDFARYSSTSLEQIWVLQKS